MGIVEMKRNIDAHLKKMNKLESELMDTSNSVETMMKKANRENSDVAKKNALDVNLLVATLVATVTFTAGFTMPGGYVDNRPDEGLATLTTKAAFQVFVVFNSLAFCCSVLAVILQLHTSLDKINRIRYMGITVGFTNMAILGMFLAYSSGTYIVLTQSITISIIPYLLCGIFIVLFFAIFTADPGVNGFRCLNWLQDYVRDKVIRYVSLKMVSSFYDTIDES